MKSIFLSFMMVGYCGHLTSGNFGGSNFSGYAGTTNFGSSHAGIKHSSGVGAGLIKDCEGYKPALSYSPNDHLTGSLTLNPGRREACATVTYDAVNKRTGDVWCVVQ